MEKFNGPAEGGQRGGLLPTALRREGKISVPYDWGEAPESFCNEGQCNRGGAERPVSVVGCKRLGWLLEDTVSII